MTREKRNLRTERIGSLIDRQIPDFIQKKSLTVAIREQIRHEKLVFKHWENICGTELAQHLRPEGLREQMLIIEADSGLWLEQARFLEGEILKRIKQLLPQVIIKKISFQVAFFQKKSRRRTDDTVKTALSKKRVRLKPARPKNQNTKQCTAAIIKNFLELF